jgi:Flp pilus assembly protein TadG
MWHPKPLTSAASDVERPDERRKSRARKQRGSSVMELTLFGPLFFFMFSGALDWGLSAYALISLESAARTAAAYTSSSLSTAADSATACSLVLGEMRSLTNIGTSVSACNGAPLSVTASSVPGPDAAQASQVTVTYTSVPMVPIPGLLPRQFTISRTVIMRIRS